MMTNEILKCDSIKIRKKSMCLSASLDVSFNGQMYLILELQLLPQKLFASSTVRPTPQPYYATAWIEDQYTRDLGFLVRRSARIYNRT